MRRRITQNTQRGNSTRIDPQGSEHRRYTQFPVLAASRVSIFVQKRSWAAAERPFPHGPVWSFWSFLNLCDYLFARKVGPWIWPKMFVFSHIGDLTSKGIWKSWTLRDFFTAFFILRLRAGFRQKVGPEPGFARKKKLLIIFFGNQQGDSENKGFKKCDFEKVNNNALISRMRGWELKAPSVQ